MNIGIIIIKNSLLLRIKIILCTSRVIFKCCKIDFKYILRSYIYIINKIDDMGSTMIEKILAAHSDRERVQPGDIVDVTIDARVARDFGGANVVKNITDHGLTVDDPAKTFFTFDCNPTGSDQKYAANQQRCRVFARENGIKVYDINRGIGTHILIEEGLAGPGTTAISTDSHANILGAVGAFGQGMGDIDIAAAWSKGKIWFKTPSSAKIIFTGERPAPVTAKDIVLNLLARFGSNSLLGYSIELYGDAIDKLKLDERITISSMATELGAIIIFIPPNAEVIQYCESRSMQRVEPVLADENAVYDLVEEVDVSSFKKLVSLPGKPHDTASVPEEKVWIDSAFIGSCTNGRMKDLEMAACVLKGRKVAPGVVLKIVPATDTIWLQALEQGLLEDLKEAGALISNAGCAGCAAGQVGQNGPGEVTISTGNRNFPGKQGQGEVYLASPDVVAASAVAGYITTPDRLPDVLPERPVLVKQKGNGPDKVKQKADMNPVEVTGRVWVIPEDDIDTDMIFHNRHLAITELSEMGAHTFGNLKGFEHFADQAGPGDIVIAGKNFGSGSSRQQAVDCFKALGVAAIIARSFGAIYERNAINSAFPIVVCDDIFDHGLKTGDKIGINFGKGVVTLPPGKKEIQAVPFSEVQLEIYKNNGLF
jgi:3-isopropylmalate/(R)-2-methylmalate dehydratase large subunit